MEIKCPKCHFENHDTQRFCGECGTQLSPPENIQISPTETLETPKEELPRGTKFAGRYEIIEELGQGRMGAVYRAEDTNVKQEIASDKNSVEEIEKSCYH